LVRWSAICASVVALLLWGAGAARSITCDECQELDKNKAVAQQDLTQKEGALETSFKKKDFQKVTDIRNQITELRKKLMELKDKSQNCKDACKPDVIKEAECRKLRGEINTLESNPSGAEADADKVDNLYRDLRQCNKDFEELKKGRK
jgi:predicted RNase H-like nuclease (RuvC/YqgF family)